jgi:hypothetical protein
VDGAVLPGADTIGDLRFSESGGSLAYAARRGKKWCVVVGGKPGREHAGVAELQFVPGTETTAYVAKERPSLFRRTASIVIGDAEVCQHTDVHRLQFFPDGRTYWVWCDTGCLICAEGAAPTKLALDGGQWQLDPLQWLRGPVFSPDGRHFAYLRAAAVVWSPCYELVVDGEEAVLLPHEPVPSGSQLAFVDPGTIELCTVNFMGHQLYRMEIAIGQEAG